MTSGAEETSQRQVAWTFYTGGHGDGVTWTVGGAPVRLLSKEAGGGAEHVSRFALLLVAPR
jgi:hypothetical protein